MSYSVTAFVPDLGPTDLVGQGRYYPADVASTYLQLPFPSAADFAGPDGEHQWQAAVDRLPDGGQWSGLFALNERVVGAETDPYRVALAVEDYLRGGFKYSLRLKAGGDSSPYADFLFNTHTGYCQHFAGAMALLLRFNGIPARVAVGFRQGREINDGVYEVRRTDAHAWVEAYFPGAGWAPFDPTPGSRLPSASDTVTPGSATGAGASGDPRSQTQRSRGRRRTRARARGGPRRDRRAGSRRDARPRRPALARGPHGPARLAGRPRAASPARPPPGVGTGPRARVRRPDVCHARRPRPGVARVADAR